MSPAPRRPPRWSILAAPVAGALVTMGLAAGCRGHAAAPPAALRDRRPLVLEQGGRWIGGGICYGPHRDGQRPGGPAPTTDELRADLRLLAPRWQLLRIYGADDPAERLLALVRAEKLPFHVLLGAWIAPGDSAANQHQVDAAIHLANAYPDVVLAVIVGNETQVTWSDHRVELDALIAHVRAVRRQTTVPVASADDFAFWLGPDSQRLVDELDFVVVHAYAMWNGESLDHALAFTQEKYAAVVARHPGVPVLLGEAGWATQRHAEGDQARLVKGEVGEGPQREFFTQFTAWTAQARIPSTYFEAFDERWKGGPSPDEIEKHWGLFRADRTPKPALAPALR